MGEQQFLGLIRDNQGIIVKLIGLYFNTADDKKDMFQEVLYQAWKSKDSFDNRSKFSTWLYRVCLNTLLTATRKTNRVVYTYNIEVYESAYKANGSASDKAKALYQAIRLLDEADRAIVTMHLDGYPNDEIAELIGISPNYVSVKLHRIKQQLSNFFKNE